MFDYDNTNHPDDETVRSVAAEMSGGGLKPLTDDERVERARWREELRQRDERDRIISERARAEAERLRVDAARRDAHEAYLRRQRDQTVRTEPQHNSELAQLRRYAERAESHRTNAERAAVANLRVQYQNSLFAELDQMIAQQFAPPKPEPGDEL
jgi:FMN phosphatase YigB (HAD superfamily)